MFGFIVTIAIAIAVCFFLFSNCSTESKQSEPPRPPTYDVHILGCNGNCGYFVPEFEKDAGGNYNATGMIYCEYQGKNVRMGSKCPFAKDHPELLGKSVFDDDFI